MIGKKSLTSAERVFKVFENSLEVLSKSDVVIFYPDFSKSTIERVLKELRYIGLIEQVGSGRAT